MIQFIELVPVVVENENYTEEMIEWENGTSLIPWPPSKTVYRHTNHSIERLFPWSDFDNTRQITIDEKYYSVASVGPKEYLTSGLNSFVQKVYIEEIKK